MGPLGDLGPVTISFGGSDLWTYFDAAHFRHTQTSVDVKEALHGNAPVDSVLTGHGPCEVDIPFTRTTYANLASLIPGGSNSGGESGNVKVYNNKVGNTMYSSSQELILKRVVDGAADTDQSNWLHIPHAYPVPNFDITFDNGTQRQFMVTFKGFPDSSTKLTWHIGDITS